MNKIIINKILITILRLSFSFEFEVTCSASLIWRMENTYTYKYACIRTKKIRQYAFMRKFNYSRDFFHKALQGTKLYSDN